MALESVQTWRYLTTATLLVLWGLIRRDTPAPASTDVWQSSSAMVPWYARILFQAGVGRASVATLALLALRWLPAATASFLFYTYPAWVAVLRPCAVPIISIARG